MANTTENRLVEAIGNLFNNDEKTLGLNKRPKEYSHTYEHQWNIIEEMFALKANKSNFFEELTSAFRDIHSYKYLDDPTFGVALTKRLTARGIPTEDIQNAIKYCEAIREDLKKNNFQEKQIGWHPDLEGVLDTTRNAQDRTPSKSEPFYGGGPAPSRNEIK